MTSLISIIIIVVVSIAILLLVRAVVWWYWGIYEVLDRLDKNNNLLTDIREILKKSTGVDIVESDIKEQY